jgi:hypothetical protein
MSSASWYTVIPLWSSTNSTSTGPIPARRWMIRKLEGKFYGIDSCSLWCQSSSWPPI